MNAEARVRLAAARPVDQPANSTPDDPRLKRINAALARHRRRPDALIELLHMVQESYGYVPSSMMAHLSKELRVAPSRVFGVATFYHLFSLKPRGEHLCVVCTGTACHVKGSRQIVDRIEAEFGVKAGGTTADGRFGLQTARCLGCCSLGPVAVIDQVIHPRAGAEAVIAALRQKVGGR